MSEEKTAPARVLSLCWGSMEGMNLPTFVLSASSAGFAAITLNTPLYFDARSAGLSDVDIHSLIADHGLAVSGIDPVFSWLPDAINAEGDDVMSRVTQASVEEVIHLAHVAGTDLINAPVGLMSLESEQHLVECFGALCEKAAAEELRVSLEFMPFSKLPTLADAARIVAKANCANGGIMFDCWHHHRGGGTAQDILLVPGEKYFALQLDDALPNPMADIMEETLNYRLLPGEGCIDLPQIFRNLDSIGAELVYDVEVFNDTLRQGTAAQRAQQLFDSSDAVVRMI